jgi:hypothetical protein
VNFLIRFYKLEKRIGKTTEYSETFVRFFNIKKQIEKTNWKNECIFGNPICFSNFEKKFEKRMGKTN